MNTETRDLLVEIGTEELPPKALAPLADEFFMRLTTLLLDVYDLKGPKGSLHHYFYSPRRLSIIVENMPVKQPDRKIERYGPAINVSFDKNGKPTKAAEGFARSCHTTVDHLEKKDGKLFFNALQTGQSATELIPVAINETLKLLPLQKRMRWGSGTAEFVRPVHWIVVLFGDDVIDCEILGVRSGRVTYGHRYHHPGPVKLKSSADYVQALHDTKVWLNNGTHDLQGEISLQARKLADEVNGDPLNNERESALVAEIAALVEWPVPIRGGFDKKFLQLPDEVLIATLEDQQRYFPVREKKTGKLLPYFIAIANIESKDQEQIRRGNERVIVPRLTDAMFFWDNDQSRPLASHRSALDEIIYQKKLGSIGDKVKRVTKLAIEIAAKIGAGKKHVERAAQLAKCDLLTNLVGEFPELQGTMGRYLALNDGEPNEVAVAVEEHYLPRFAGDRLPATATGQALAIADKLDTITGISAIGQFPTGEKDPFGLRRAALGCLRIMIECELRLDLYELLEDAVTYFPGKLIIDNLPEQIFDFMMERLRRYYLDNNISADTFDAVISRRPTDPYDFHQRIIAVSEFRKLPEAESLAVANKRISNILKQANSNVHEQVDNNLLSEPAEKKLASVLAAISKRLAPALEKNEYSKALTELAALKQDVDTFFDQVMVMCDDESIKNNRLALLKQLNQLFLKTADISRLQNQI
jgi:glycyl-tRNA synthetase beta chain